MTKKLPSLILTPNLPVSPTGTHEDNDSKCVQCDEPVNTVRTTITFNPSIFSPTTDKLHGHFGSMDTPLSIFSDRSSQASNSLSPAPSSPFNFSPQIITENSMMLNSNVGKRRGHRYKHSSISAQHQIFLEPPPRAPLALPASLPIPTFKEACSSRSKEQTLRVACCVCHALVALYVYYSAAGSLALTALSHLIFFDAVSATICVIVDVLCNFEVWKRSSVRHPFGLERAEVLAGFAMSVFLLFMGFDLISHNLKHTLESLGSHFETHAHSQKRVSLRSVDSAAILCITATLISAFGLKNHARIGKTMRYSFISFLPSILSNPSHLLTLVSSTVMLLLPFLSIDMYHWIDRIFCSIIAFSMFVLGAHLAMDQALILLMCFLGEGVNDVIREIKEEPMVIKVEEAKFWQVHYTLCIASLKFRVQGDEASLIKLRERIRMLVLNRLGSNAIRGEMKWEVTTQFTIEK